MKMLRTVLLGNTLLENAVALNIGHFVQFIHPFYARDMEKGDITKAQAQELIDCLWMKLSEWIWFVFKNTAAKTASYNASRNLTVGGKKADGTDSTDDLS